MLGVRSLMATFCVLQIRPGAACSGDACSGPCTCSGGDGQDVECNDAKLTALPCHIPPRTPGMYVSNNNITAINPGDLKGLSSLKYLFAAHNQIKTLDRGSLGGLGALGELFLADNQITQVAAAAFDSNTELSYIELNDNRLVSLPPDLPLSISMLSLVNNSITAVDANAFRGRSKLQSLELGGNKISKLDSATFRDVPLFNKYVGRLCLDRNPLDCCGMEWLREIPALDALCPAKATCAFPVEHRGKALKDIKGRIC